MMKRNNIDLTVKFPRQRVMGRFLPGDVWFLLGDVWFLLGDVWFLLGDVWFLLGDMRFLLGDIFKIRLPDRILAPQLLPKSRKMCYPRRIY